MRIFLSSSRENRAQAGRVMDELEALGYEVTLRWDRADAPDTYTDTDMERLATGLYEAILACDVYALLLPGGINSHVELGIAVTSGRRCVVLSEAALKTREDEPLACAFYCFPGVTRYRMQDTGRAAGIIALEADLLEMRRTT